jgi:hypothetical protein
MHYNPVAGRKGLGKRQIDTLEIKTGHMIFPVAHKSCLSRENIVDENHKTPMQVLPKSI